jgi:cation:H+ antiporter
LHYLYKAFTHEGEVGQEPEQLHFDRLARLGSHRLRLIIPQVVLGVYGIVNGAYLFVDHMQSLAVSLGVPAVVLSLIVAPMATELPEQVNCVLWARTGKDTLAISNIFGSLVFQSCFPIALGVGFTDWHLPPPVLIAAAIALTLASTYWYLIKTEKLRAQHLLCGFLVYAVTLAAFVLVR